MFNNGNFVSHDTILNRTENIVNLFHKYCPHRRYPLGKTGECLSKITCFLHGYEWDENGTPLNNHKKLHRGHATVGRSGIVFENFVEPNHRWVDDLERERDRISHSHSFHGESEGSYLWLMDIEADLLHLDKGVHPFLSKQIDLNDIKMDQGDGWILQSHLSGWWLYVFPYTFIEYGNPGCIMLNTVFPKNPDSEFGFNWITQFFYAKDVGVERRMIFETLETVFKEDVVAIEKQKGPYYPLMRAESKYEDHCVHFGKWIIENKIK
jgi:hypothetical protein